MAQADGATIKHVFVLMLENRSFDHMLGFSGINGNDAKTGGATSVDGLCRGEFNKLGGTQYAVSQPADWVMPLDPAHEFENVVHQLCGIDASYSPARPYPPIDNSGFVADYASIGGQNAPGEIMKCYAAAQLPVLNALAREFAVFDRWFSSMPGPTWPNRFFVHAASSGGLDHSPTGMEIASWETVSGFTFENGTIFQRLDSSGKKLGWRIYSGGAFPSVAALKGINNFQVHDLDDFASDVAAAGYPACYTFIEPNYGDVISNTFRGGNSQHPLDDVTRGEALIKQIYEAIRNSPLWPSSLLIVTWDEHGGFYDHVAPPTATPPGDRIVTKGAGQYGFTFGQYGVRVPAVAASPLIPKNLINHQIYDHASIPATLESLFGLKPLTGRDASANTLAALATLTTPRGDTPTKLPDPVVPPRMAAMTMVSPSSASLADSIDGGNLPGFLHAALRTDLDLSPPAQRQEILNRFANIKTRAGAQRYMDRVEQKLQAARVAVKRVKQQPLQASGSGALMSARQYGVALPRSTSAVTPSSQIGVSDWVFQYVDPQTQIVLQWRVPATQALIAFTVDCTSANLLVNTLTSINADNLLPTGTVQATGDMPVPDHPTPGQSYVTRAQVTLDNFVSFLDLQQGLYWAECATAATGHGVPRFGLRVRSGLTYTAKTLLFTQQWTTNGNWGALTAQSTPIDHGTQTQLGAWSDMQQLGATLSPCTECLTMPTQAPHGAWSWGPVKRYPLTPGTLSGALAF